MDKFLHPAPLVPATTPPPAGRFFARILSGNLHSPCALEASLVQQGAHVTRLPAGQLLRNRDIDPKTARVLGGLYDGLIVPAEFAHQANALSVAAGVPVYCVESCD